MSDELPTAARVSDPGIRALYRLENRWQAWLDVEAALARFLDYVASQPKVWVCSPISAMADTLPVSI